MTEPPTLSGDEIAALMNELHEPPAKPEGASHSPRPFAFGSDAARPMNALPALDRMNERMSRRLRDLLEPFVRAKPTVTAEDSTIRIFGDWKAEQPEFVSLSLYAFKPMKGAILLALQPEFVRRLVDCFYGGAGDSPATPSREFTPTEESLLGRLADSVLADLATVWSEVMPARPQLRSRETNVEFATMARGDETVAVTRFVVKFGRAGASHIDIVYPVSSLRSVEQELLATSPEDVSARGEEWRERLLAAIGQVRVRARTVLARPDLSLAELMQLRPGDVIPISLPAQVPLLVEGRPIALGTIGEHDGRAALKIEKIEKRRNMQ
ncbi:flagellar motor switch protein FliM [Sphingosinicella sp. CPCC 101087]|uniref:flagellar motor switch protein FliM n=1 Tax=Sphingosinicella sp. CPCC 101087 TaxID=2497754 RepID=UPI00101BFB52|nr:flagellar motor switch protein FliM [Sphingosinicella sp. CPCC 101087]